MCGFGILWQYKTHDALDALDERSNLLRALRRHTGWLVDELAARFVFTELVTNVAIHASGPVEISLECDGESVLLRVADRGPGFAFNPNLPADLFAANGRGGFLVSHFTSDVQVEKNLGHGTTIVAKLASSPG
jgi:anti-sigma regulatory factor (Ser/Thr protein kinase)